MKITEFISIVASLIAIITFLLTFFFRVHHYSDLRWIVKVVRMFTKETTSENKESNSSESPDDYIESVECWPARTLGLLIIIAAVGGAHSGLMGHSIDEIIQTYTHQVIEASDIIRKSIEMTNFEGDAIAWPFIGLTAKYGAIFGAMLGPFFLGYIIFRIVLEVVLGVVLENFKKLFIYIGEHYRFLNRHHAKIFASTFVGSVWVGAFVGSLLTNIPITNNRVVMSILGALSTSTILSVYIFYMKTRQEKT